MDSVPFQFIEDVLRLIREERGKFEDFPAIWRNAANLECATYLLQFGCCGDRICYQIDSDVSLETLLTSKRTVCDEVWIFDASRDTGAVLTADRLSQLCALVRRSYKPVRTVAMDLYETDLSRAEIELVEKLAESIRGIRTLRFGEPRDRGVTTPFLSPRLLDTVRMVEISSGNYCQPMGYLIFASVVKWWRERFVPTSATEFVIDLHEKFHESFQNETTNTPEMRALLKTNCMRHPRFPGATLRIRPLTRWSDNGMYCTCPR